jgi:hypothetical protein
MADETLDIIWPAESSIKFLGVLINNDTEKMQNENFQAKLEKIQELVNSWCLRKMTLKGKATVINSLLASQMIYIGTVLHTPEWAIKSYNGIVTDFLWDSKPAKVKYSNIICDIADGGLKIQDIECKLKSVKTKWVQAMCDVNTQCAWKSYINAKFSKDVNQVLLCNLNTNDLLILEDKFYQEIFQIWVDLHNKQPTDGQQACRQMICDNSFIRIDGLTITNKTWKYNNIKYIQDLLNRNGEIDTKENIETKFNVVLNQMVYNSVVRAIPRE